MMTREETLRVLNLTVTIYTTLFTPQLWTHLITRTVMMSLQLCILCISIQYISYQPIFNVIIFYAIKFNKPQPSFIHSQNFNLVIVYEKFIR